MTLRLHGGARLLLAIALGAAATASAQNAGQWTLKVGANNITPKVESGDVSAPALPRSKAAVDSDAEPVLFIGYSVSDNISAELDLGLPYKHTISGAGAIEGTGKLGTVEVLPPTILAQYRFFTPAAKWRPYVGLGATYAYFQKARGSAQMTAITNTGGPATTFKIDNKMAATLQVGLAMAINERWYADLALTKTYLKTVVRYSTGQTQDMKLDPLGVNFGIGYKF